MKDCWKLKVERWTLNVFLFVSGFISCSTIALADEPQEFFQTFATAAGNYEQGKTREAVGILQSLCQKLQGVPWRDIALLKAAELQESFDRPAAAKNYKEVTGRLKDRATDKLSQCELANANRGMQRLDTVEIEAALSKYYLDKVQYPASLEVLVQAKYLTDDKIRDVAGKLYAYSTGVEKLVPSVPRQTYTLEKIPAPPFVLRDAKIVGMSQQTVQVQTPNTPSRSLRVGDKLDDMEVLSVLDNGIILGNDSRLVVLSYK